MDRNWYSDFFRDIVVDTWRMAASPEQTRIEADFLEQALELRTGQSVLDIPCGFGRHSIDLAGRGYQMTGVDVSAEMIQHAQEHARASRVDVQWRNAEMRDIEWKSEFDAAFCFGNSFGYLDPKGTRTFLSAISCALKSGARFALDYGMAAECILPRFTEREWMPVDNLLFLENNRFDVTEGCIETTYTFVRGGQTQTRTGLHWVYTVREIRQMLREAALTTVAFYSSYDRRPFELGSPVLIPVAEKE